MKNNDGTNGTVGESVRKNESRMWNDFFFSDSRDSWNTCVLVRDLTRDHVRRIPLYRSKRCPDFLHGTLRVGIKLLFESDTITSHDIGTVYKLGRRLVFPRIFNIDSLSTKKMSL